jgi:hypothetical protein
VSDAERAELPAMLTSGLLALFESMPAADQRHGLDVAAALRRAGHGEDRELIVAGLLHDAGKGPRVRLWHRVAWSLGTRYGHGFVAAGSLLPGARPVFERLARHAEISAQLAAAAGASARTVRLIAEQSEPRDEAAVALHRADEGELRGRPAGGS